MLKLSFLGGIIIQRIATAPCAPAKSLVFTVKKYLVILVLVVCTAGIHPHCSNSSFSAKHEKKTLWQCLSRKKQVSQHSLFVFTFCLCKNTIWCWPLFFCHSLFADTLNMNLNFRVLAWLSWVQVARQRLQIPEGTRVTRLCCFLAGNLTRCGLTSIHSKNAGSYVRCYFTQRWRVKTYMVKIHKGAHNATQVAYFLCKYSN